VGLAIATGYLVGTPVVTAVVALGLVLMLKTLGYRAQIGWLYRRSAATVGILVHAG
jgi:hypothetical protein